MMKEKTTRYRDHSSSQGSLTSACLLQKSVCKSEEFLDFIRPVWDWPLYLQFRYGSFPVATFITSWRKINQGSEYCCYCKNTRESEEHLFFCPLYAKPRSKWIVPMCRALSLTTREEAYRVCKSNTSSIVAVCTFLAWLVVKC